MKKGKVKALTLSHKNGNKVLRAGDHVDATCVVDFDTKVKQGFIEPDEATKKLYKEAEEKAKAEKAKAKKEAEEKAKK